MCDMNERLSRMMRTFGPGIMFASTAIGVSHLVQSTRAGAEFGFGLVAIVLLANILKYPFFEFSSRYANATGTSLIDGYKKLGRWALGLYFIITVASMFFVTAAVGLVTAGFMENLFGVTTFGIWGVAILFAVCSIILIIGRYTVLDSLIKIIATVILVSTVLAFALAVYSGPAEHVDGFVAPEIWSGATLFFVIALMGWMPIPIDVSAWHGLWTLERIRQTKFKPSLKETLLDFNIGYVLVASLSVLFLILGTYIFYGTGNALPASSGLFAHKVVQIYTETIGGWSELIISISAFSVMFGTIIAVFDGYSRSITRVCDLLTSKSEPISKPSWKKYVPIVLILATTSFVVLMQFGDKIKELVDFATTISFVIAPVVAYFNIKLVSAKYVGIDVVPPLWLRALSYAGLAFLSGFAVIFIIVYVPTIF